MSNADYAAFWALDPFFAVVQRGLKDFVDGDHYFDMIADDAVFEFLYHFPGWPRSIHGRKALMAAYSGYGNNIVVHRGDGLAVHPVVGGHVVIIEYEVHGKIVRTGGPYDNRFISVVTIKNRKIVRWRDYMDSLSAWVALNNKG
jgi:ketosteroid isomerase-like protein